MEFRHYGCPISFSGAPTATEFTVFGKRLQISLCSDSVKVMSRLVVTSYTTNRDITRPDAPLTCKATTQRPATERPMPHDPSRYQICNGLLHIERTPHLSSRRALPGLIFQNPGKARRNRDWRAFSAKESKSAVDQDAALICQFRALIRENTVERAHAACGGLIFNYTDFRRGKTK